MCSGRAQRRRRRSWKWRAEWASAVRPDGRSNPLDRNGEHITYAALGLDDARRARVAFELAPQAKNLHVDAAIENILMHARGLQQVLATERPLRRIEKGDQQGVLAFGQCYGSAGRVGEPPSLAVELPAAKSKAAALGIESRRGTSHIETSQYRADTREQFAQIEWLSQIIVGTEFKSNDTIDIVAAVTSNDDDRHVRARADLPQQIETVLVTEPKIEDHQVDLGAAELTDHILAIASQQGTDVILSKIV